jgi:subtilisin family serine protease
MRYSAQHRFVLLFLFLAAALAAQTETILIRAGKPYTNLVRSIESGGGRVTAQYQNFDGIAAEIQRSQLEAITSLAGAGNVSKDLLVPAPTSVNTTFGRNLTSTGDENNVTAASVEPLGASDIVSIASTNPAGYKLNSSIINASPLHAAGILGQGIIVAVIDSGIRPGFPHITLDGSVIGCLDFVGDALGCMNSGNNPHGTFVAGMISANINFGFPAASAFRSAVLAECPACFANPPTNTVIPMIGTAPLSSIYAFRIFGPTGGAPTSRLLAAIDKVIDLRNKFDVGQPGGVNIKVCNMSLAGATLLPAGDLASAALSSMLAADIVPVVAASNAGPATLTVGSPGSSLAAITVGAASLAHNERILERLQYGPAVGSLFRPFLGTQTAFFSSRGPNADGRTDPDVSANGFASFGQGSGLTSSITLGSGTSFATPSVSGVAALLRQAVPTATARQVRNAIIATANPALFADGSGPLDRGAGYADALAARNLLATGTVPDTAPSAGNTNSSVQVNIEKNTDLNVRDGFVRQTISGLKPGQRSDILYRVSPNTKQVVVTLSNVTPANPPSGQNQLFGDDILIAIHSAKTSSIGEGDYKTFSFSSGGTFTVNDPETGIIRVSVNGDWTNAGTISADVAIVSVTDPVPQFTTQGRIGPGQLIAMPLTIPAGVAKADFRLSWREDWGQYPLNDLDLILIAPNGAVNVDGAGLNSPETASIDHPLAGTWTVLLNGFEINTGDDKYELRIALDGKVVK